MSNIYLTKKLNQILDLVADCIKQLNANQFVDASEPSSVTITFTESEIYVNGAVLFNCSSIEYEIMNVLLKHYLLDMINGTTTQLNSLQIIQLFNPMYAEDDLYKTIYRIRKKICRFPFRVSPLYGYQKIPLSLRTERAKANVHHAVMFSKVLSTFFSYILEVSIIIKT